MFVLMRLDAYISLVALTVKNPPIKRETQVPSLGWEDPPGEGNGNPHQCSCLENPMDRGTWQAVVHSLSESNTTEVTWHASTCLVISSLSDFNQ